MYASSSTDLSHVSYECAPQKSWTQHVYKLAKAKSFISSLKRNLKMTWLRLNGNDPEVAKFGLIALVAIGALVGASFYVSFFDGWIREVCFLLKHSGV